METTKESYWLWISTPRATGALHVKDGVIETAPPYFRWSVGCDAIDIIERVSDIGGTRVMRISDEQTKNKVGRA